MHEKEKTQRRQPQPNRLPETTREAILPSKFPRSRLAGNQAQHWQLNATHRLLAAHFFQAGFDLPHCLAETLLVLDEAHA